MFNSFIISLFSSRKTWCEKIFFGLFFLIFSAVFPQENLPDSLIQLGYKELGNRSYDLNMRNRLLNKSRVGSDSVDVSVYSRAFLQKAKNEHDTLQMANAYYQLITLATINNQLAQTDQYADSIILLTSHKPSFEYPGRAHLRKGGNLHRKGAHEKALSQYLIAHKYGTESQNFDLLLHVNSELGGLKFHMGKVREARHAYRQQLNILKQHKSTEERPFLMKAFNVSENTTNSKKKRAYSYLRIFYGLAETFLKSSEPDSAQVYINKGINLLSKNLETAVDSLYQTEFRLFSAIAKYQKKQYQNALDELSNTALFYGKLSMPWANHRLFLIDYYRGNIFREQGDESKAFSYFKKADSLYNKGNVMATEIREVQVYFIAYHKKRGNIKKQLQYINKLLYLDSISNKNYQALDKTLVKEYDTPALLAEKESIIHQLKKKSTVFSVLVYGLGCLSVLALFFVVFFYKRKQLYKKRFHKLMEKDSAVLISAKQPTDLLSSIPQEIVEGVLKGLEKFEADKLFTHNNMNLNKLAKKLKTNSSYLSKIINHHKQKNFVVYLSDLRIHYCIERLKTDDAFGRYSIEGIAFEIGFNSAEAFSKSFYRKTGLYPSFFVKELKKVS